MHTPFFSHWAAALRWTPRSRLARTVALLDSALGISVAFGADWQVALHGGWCCLNGRLDALRPVAHRRAAPSPRPVVDPA